MPSLISAGTSTNTAVSITGDTSGALAFATNNGTTAVTITTGQQVQVNTGGSASAPVISKSDDTNTGIFFPAADTIAFAEGGVESVRIDSSGNMGIGTSSPSSALTVAGAISLNNVALPSAGTARLYSRNTDSSLYIQSGSGNTTYLLDGSQNTMANFGSSLVAFSTGNTERMRIDTSGTTYIGRTTTARSALLSVNGPVLATNSGVDGVYANAFVAQYAGNINEANIILSQVGGNSGFRFDCSNGGGSSATTTSLTVLRTSVAVAGSLSKGSGSFKIDHPLPTKTDTHHLVHSFIEGPQADLIYRGVVNLVNGIATVNIDTSADMTEGTFESLCREVQCFTTNETDWTAIRGKVIGNILTIESQDTNATSTISWMVIGERKDKHMYDTEWTDENGKVIVEPLKLSVETTDLNEGA